MKNNLFKYYIAATYFCSTCVMLAQPSTEDTTGAGNLEGADAAPIDDYIWVLALVGLFFVFMKYKAIQNRSVSR